MRLFTLLATGGCLLQVAGCLTGVVPVFVSFGQSAIASYLLDALAH